MLTYLTSAILVAPHISSTLIDIVEKRDISDRARSELQVLRLTEDVVDAARELTTRIMQ